MADHVVSRRSDPVGLETADRVVTGRRWLYLDDLKLVLIGGIIVGHAFMGYGENGSWWSYAEVAETHLSTFSEVVLLVVAGPFSLFLISLLFLMSGMLTPGSIERKGPGAFARDRLIHLGIPFVVFVGLLWPLLLFGLYRSLGLVSNSSLADFFGADGIIDTGPMWFVGVLLVYSLAYAGWVAWRKPPTRVEGRIGARHLFIVAGMVAMSTFLVRLVFRFGTETPGDLNLWEWPGCIALFGLGIAGYHQGWLESVPPQLARVARRAALVALSLTALLVTVTLATAGTVDDLGGGWAWSALVFATLEASLTVFGSLWLLAVAQRRLGNEPVIAAAWVRSAYGAFIFQAFVLIGLAMTLRPVPFPAELKAAILAVSGVIGSFALSRVLISRVRWLERILT